MRTFELIFKISDVSFQYKTLAFESFNPDTSCILSVIKLPSSVTFSLQSLGNPAK